MATSAPAGYHTITPRIFTDDPEGLIRFVKAVFDADGEYEGERPAELRVGDSVLIVGGTELRPAMPACLYVYVDDVDRTYQRALAAGARSIEVPGDMSYGDRRAMVEDQWGDLWQIAVPIARGEA
jgi:PhnB protein